MGKLGLHVERRSFVLGGAFAAILLIVFYFAFFSGRGAGTHAYSVFSPNSEEDVAGLIRSAHKTIDLEMYVFTDERIARELADASARGVLVRVILEKRAESYNLDEISSALLDAGVQVRWASLNYKLTHSKMMVIDGERVFVGSTNFSNSALNENREMAVVLDGGIVSDFILGFEKDWGMAARIK
ncbi:MAG: phospholipase D-like domain-containing protein [Candidatus Micrarchaeota archaeon]